MRQLEQRDPERPRSRRRAILPATLTGVMGLALSCGDCWPTPPEPRYPPLQSSYALVSVQEHPSSPTPELPKVYRTDPDGTVYRVIADTLRFNFGDSTYSQSGRIAAQKPGEAEVITQVTTSAPLPRFTRLRPGSFRLPQRLHGTGAEAHQSSADTLNVIVNEPEANPPRSQAWRYVPVPGTR